MQYSSSQSFSLRNRTHTTAITILENPEIIIKKADKNQTQFSSNTIVGRFFENIFQKKPIFYFISFLTLFGLLPTGTITAQVVGEQKTFIATAYYSPLPNQQKYYTGDYESEKRLNGDGIAGSDGTPVYIGMIAAPKNYAFGTKIHLNGLGIVSVHDRGGAINTGDGIDRIDIWMGSGDEGLNRTLLWGRREITGTIVDENNSVSLNLNQIDPKIPSHIQSATDRLEALGFSARTNFREAVKNFQIANNIIPNENHPAAWVYGPKTTAKLLQKYNEIFGKKSSQYQAPIALENIVSFEENPQKSKISSEHINTSKIGTYDEKVKNLQIFLSERGHYNDAIDGKMTIWVLGALRKYQAKNKLAQTGRVDAKTRKTIENDLKK